MKRNLLFIICDQLRADFLGCYGADFVRTPHLDALRADGACFDRAVSPSPLCVPARASLLTGRNAVANGVLDNVHWLRPDRRACGVDTWPETLGAAGYRTAAIGKMHFYPWDIHEGFHDRVVAEDKRHLTVRDDYHTYLAARGAAKRHPSELPGYQEHRGAVVNPLPGDQQVDQWVADHTCDYLAAYDHDQPFALMASFPGPHCPYDPAQEDLDQVDADAMPEPIPATEESRRFRDFFVRNNKAPWNGVDYTDFTAEHKRKLRQHYGALIQRIDRGVGQILDQLKARGLYETTTVVFTSDHGEMMGDMDLMAKHFFFETSVRVPLLIKDPAWAPGSQVDKTVSLTDLHATILDHAGVDPPADPRDSLSLLRPESVDRRAPVFGATDLGFMITDDTWKLCRHANGAQMLYHRQDDPREQTNRFDDPACAAERDRLDRLLTQRLTESILQSHEEKAVFTPSTDRSAFGERGWRRPYPNPPA